MQCNADALEDAGVTLSAIDAAASTGEVVFSISSSTDCPMFIFLGFLLDRVMDADSPQYHLVLFVMLALQHKAISVSNPLTGYSKVCAGLRINPDVVGSV